MATKKVQAKKATDRKGQVKTNVKKFHDGLLQTSEDLLKGSIEAGAKWQDLLAKTIKKSEPIAEKNIDIIFDTAEKIRGEVSTGTTRVKTLLGVDDNLFSDLKDKVTNNTIIKRFRGEVEEIVEEVSDVKIVKKAKKMAVKAKVEIQDAIEDIKEDVTEVADTIKSKITDVTSDTVKTDLKVINGIGPKLEEVLNAAGIQNYSDLVKASKSDLRKILDQAGSRYKMHNPEDWKAQAKLAAANKMDELKAWSKSK